MSIKYYDRHLLLRSLSIFVKLFYFLAFNVFFLALASACEVNNSATMEENAFVVVAYILIRSDIM